jgi:hypothetical protein
MTAAGVQDARIRRDPTTEQLVEEINIDAPELITKRYDMTVVGDRLLRTDRSCVLDRHCVLRTDCVPSTQWTHGQSGPGTAGGTAVAC